MSFDSESVALMLDPTTFLRALKRVVVRLLALQEALQGQIIKDDALRRNFAAAVLRLYENEEALLVSLLHNAISQAIRIPESESLVLREGSLMVDLLSEFAQQAVAPQRNRMVPLVQRLVKDNAPMEVDPTRLGITLSSSPDGDCIVPPALQLARENLVQCATGFLRAIIASVDATPRAFKKVIRMVYESAEARFPGSGYRTLGGVIFLRLFCPAIVAPEAHNLSTTPVPASARRSLILVAKLLQSLVNEASYEKEDYMLHFNPWIQENVDTIRNAFLSWVQQGATQHPHEACEPRTVCLSDSSSEWRLSSSSSSSSDSSSSSLDQSPCGDAIMDEATVQAIELGLKESMKVLRSYDEELAVRNAIKNLELRYKEVKHSMRAICASTSSALASSSTVHTRSGSQITKVKTRQERQRSLSEEGLSSAEDSSSPTTKRGSLINRLTSSGRTRSASRGSIDDFRSVDIARWDHNLVFTWLRSLDVEEDCLKDYRKAFKKHNVNGLKLQQLTRESLVELGVRRLGDRKKIIAQTQQLYRDRLTTVQAKDPKDWTVDDVAVWLGANELVEYQEQWMKDCVNGQVLLEALTFEPNLRRLNVTKCGHRKKLVRLLRESTSPRSSSE